VARMYPSDLNETRTVHAERLLFNELKRQLPGAYSVLHSVSWISIANGRHLDGEADFVIAHPDLGVMVLEVKGGEIRRDPEKATWLSVDQYGVVHSIKDPFDQARRAMYALRDKLAATPATAAFRYPLSRAVAFPDVIVPGAGLGPDAPRDLIIDSARTGSLAAALDRAWEKPRDGGPGASGVKALVDLLRPGVSLPVSLAGEIRRDRLALEDLTEQQVHLLDLLSGHRRLAISGTAGSGKTILALEQARRLARQGYRVLYTCFNKALAEAARVNLASTLGAEDGRVVASNYHDLARDFARRAQISVPSEAEINARANPAEYYETELPDKLLAALGTLPDRFDAIVVDEGQDFADEWWVTLEELLANGDDGGLFIFYDDNQRLYRRQSSYPIAGPHFRLTRNCRSTRSIHTTATAYADQKADLDCAGPVGRAVEVLGAETDHEVDALRKTVHRLTKVEGIDVADLILLTPRSARTSQFRDELHVGNYRLSWESSGPGMLACRNIHGFKGLERPVVILGETNRAHPDTRNALLYVAITRAQHHVVVLGSLPDPGTA
jgi:hypothetical protein